MHKYLQVSLLTASVVVAGCGKGASGSASGGPLKFNPKVNTPYVYAQEVKTSGNAGPMKLDADIKTTESTVFTSASSGSFQAVATVTDASGTAPGGQNASSLKGSKRTMGVSDQGEITSDTTSGAVSSLHPADGIGAGVQGATFPAGDLHIGQTWTSTVDLAKSSPALASGVTGGQANVVATYKVANLVGDTVTIAKTTKSSFQTKAGTVSMDGDGSCDYSRADGTLLKSSEKLHVKVTGMMAADVEMDTATTKQ